MIGPNDVPPTRQQLRHAERQRAKHGKQNAQHAINSLLWKIVMQNGGKINVPCSELKDVPVNIALEIKYVSATDTMIVVAGTQQLKQKTNIIVPNNGIIN